VIRPTIVLAALLGFLARPAGASDEDIETAGDILQLALPIGAAVTTLLKHDKVGTIQFAKSAAGSTLIVRGLKPLIAKWRPTTSNQESFPSGHTQGAFLGASFFASRYGPAWGIPAYALAGFTGYSRVNADAHFLDDVVAGASIAMLVNWAFVTPQSSDVVFQPTYASTRDGGRVVGFEIALNPGAPDRSGDEPPMDRSRFTYRFDFGSAWQVRNKVRSPATGTEFDLTSVLGFSDPTTTSQALLSYRPDDLRRHEFALGINPTEYRDYTVATYGFFFVDKVIPAGTALNTAYRLYEWGLSYRYEVVDTDRWSGWLGLAATIQDVKISLTNLTLPGRETTEVKDLAFIPLLHGAISRRLGRRFEVTAEFDWYDSSTDFYYKGAVFLYYGKSERWRFGLGYSYWSRRIDTDELTNAYTISSWLLNVSHSW